MGATTPPRLGLRFRFRTSFNLIGLEKVTVAADEPSTALLSEGVAVADDEMPLSGLPTSKMHPIELTACRAVPLDGLSVCYN